VFVVVVKRADISYEVGGVRNCVGGASCFEVLAVYDYDE